MRINPAKAHLIPISESVEVVTERMDRAFSILDNYGYEFVVEEWDTLEVAALIENIIDTDRVLESQDRAELQEFVPFLLGAAKLAAMGYAAHKAIKYSGKVATSAGKVASGVAKGASEYMGHAHNVAQAFDKLKDIRHARKLKDLTHKTELHAAKAAHKAATTGTSTAPSAPATAPTTAPATTTATHPTPAPAATTTTHSPVPAATPAQHVHTAQQIHPAIATVQHVPATHAAQTPAPAAHQPTVTMSPQTPTKSNTFDFNTSKKTPAANAAPQAKPSSPTVSRDYAQQRAKSKLNSKAAATPPALHKVQQIQHKQAELNKTKAAAGTPAPTKAPNIVRGAHARSAAKKATAWKQDTSGRAAKAAKAVKHTATPQAAVPQAAPGASSSAAAKKAKKSKSTFQHAAAELDKLK